MFSLTRKNKKILSIAFFWLAVGLFVVGVSFLGYHMTTSVPSQSITGVEIALRALFPIVIAGLAGVISRGLYVSCGSPEGMFSQSMSSTPLTDDAVSDESTGLREAGSQATTSETDGAGTDVEAPREQTDEEFAYEARRQGALTERDSKSSILARIHRVMVQTYPDVALLATKESKYEDDAATEPIEFSIVAAKDGGFADPKIVDRLFVSVTKSIPKGTILWGMAEHVEEDRLVFSKKTPFPPMVFPDETTPVTSPEDALERYDDMRFIVGVDAYGNKITIDPQKSPHGLVVGGSGSGKSVFTNGLIESVRVAGWQIVINDGKMTDYAAMNSVPNIIAVGGKLKDWVRITQFVEEQMDARYARAKERAKRGLEPRFDQPPMLFLLDEFGSIMRNVRGSYGNAGAKVFIDTLKNIAAKARQARIHMVIATQDVYKETLDGDLKANLKYIISLGKASDRTLSDAFTAETKATAKRIGQSITDDDRGRGIIEIGTDDGTTVVEFQTYYAYSPGMEMEKRSPAKEKWTSFKKNVSDHVPLMYPRMWYEEPTPDEFKDIDTVEGLLDLKFFALQRSDGTAIESKRIYDVMDDDYVGDMVSEGAATVLGFGDDSDNDEPDSSLSGLVDEDTDDWAESPMSERDSEAYDEPKFE